MDNKLKKRVLITRPLSLLRTFEYGAHFYLFLFFSTLSQIIIFLAAAFSFALAIESI
jgi:hypothetical protein